MIHSGVLGIGLWIWISGSVISVISLILTGRMDYKYQCVDQWISYLSDLTDPDRSHGFVICIGGSAAQWSKGQ